jgi:hypothetical protein
MQSASVEVALRSALKRRAGYVLVVNCALGVLLFRANRLLDRARLCSGVWTRYGSTQRGTDMIRALDST